MSFNNFVRDGVAASYLVTAEELQVLWNNQYTKYTLNETNLEEVERRRLAKEPTFVVMSEGKLYLTDVGMDFPRLVKNLDEKDHLCTLCKYCNPVNCIKVRDCSEELYMKEGYVPFEAMKMSKRIEKYPFIRFGYEVFGIIKENEVFGVDECANFYPLEKRKRLSISQEEELERKMEYIRRLVYG